MEEFKGIGRVSPPTKTKDEIIAEYERTTVEAIAIVHIDLSWGNVVVLALKFGVVWAVMGIVAALIVAALT